MAPARRKSAPRASTRGRGGARSRGRQAPAAVEKTEQDVYHEMAAEVASAEPSQDRPLKRRRTGKALPPGDEPSTSTTAAAKAQADVDALFDASDPEDDLFEDVEIQIPEPARDEEVPDDGDDDDDDDDDDEGMEWEDAGPQESTLTALDEAKAPEAETGDLSIVITKDETPGKKATRAKRRGLTSADRERRLVSHKLHVACLLSHCFLRNSWCNDGSLRDILKRVLPAKTIHLLHPDRDLLQAQRTYKFVEGLKAAVDRWRSLFEITGVGMQKPLNGPLENFKLDDDIETIIDRSEFRQAAKDREGSADTGAQLFCSLLRSVAVDARLVCSLQVVSFSNVGQLANVQDEPSKTTIYAGASDQGSDLQKRLSSGTPDKPKPKSTQLTPPRLSRIGRPSPSSSMGKSKQPSTSATNIKSSIDIPDYPVFWVEAFNEASQKWIPVDPIISGTVGKPSILEPPMNNDKNIMSYAIAFEEDGAAKDVTRRYAHQYTAKTRRRRVEYTEGGEAWFRKLLRPFKRWRTADRDQIENAELDRKEAHEGMPRNIEDFKGHPIYVLDRHLKHNEIIHPKHVAGKVQVSRSSSGTEPVFRRRDVHLVRSAEKWYRFGREVRIGEQPMKYAKPRKSRGQSPDEEQLDAFGDPIGAGLYAQFQTKQYVPPRVIDGRLPKNSFGNIDVYVPSMVPEGAVHIHSSLAVKAARLINVDYAEAKIGFRFKARRGEPVFDGAIVAEEYGDAVQAAVDGFEYAKEMIEINQRAREVLRLWKKFFKGLMILQHVEQYKVDGEDQGFQEEMEQVDTDEGEPDHEPTFEAGGFLLDANTGPPAQPTALGSTSSISAPFGDRMPEGRGFDAPTPSLHTPEEAYGGGFVPDDAGTSGGGGFMIESQGGGFVANETEEGGGFIADESDRRGFLPKLASDDQDGGGGFLPDETDVDVSTREPDSAASQKQAAGQTDGAFIPNEPEPKMSQETGIDSDPEIPQEILLESLRTKQEFEESKAAAEQSRAQNTDLGVGTPMSEQPANRETRPGTSSPTANKSQSLGAPPSPVAPASPQAPAEAEEDDDSDSVDRGSLLSHDPEDDDLEPDWLE